MPFCVMPVIIQLQRAANCCPRTYIVSVKSRFKLPKHNFSRSMTNRRNTNSFALQHKTLEVSLPPMLRKGIVCQALRRFYSNFTVLSNGRDLNEKMRHECASKSSNADSDSFRHLITRFKKLEKNPNSDSIEDVVIKAEKVARVFLGLTNMPNMKNTMIENLNTMLNFYDRLELSSEFNKLLLQMQSLLIANETTYFLYIRHHMKTKPWKDGLQIVENMKKNGIEIHARTYYHIILNALRAGDLQDAIAMMQSMKDLQKMFHDEFYKLLFDTAFGNQKKTKDFVFNCLDLLKDTGYVLGPKAFGSLKRWFESDKRTWKVGTSLVNIRGVCKCCGMELKKFSLPDKQRINLQEKLRSIAENAIFNSTGVNDRPQLPMFTPSSKNDSGLKVQTLKHYLENNGPFDIGLDVLNAAYFRDRGFNSFQVKRVVRYFRHMGKRVLALCSSPLVSSLLEVDSAPNLPDYHMIQLLHYLRRQQCGIFFVDDTKEDGHIDDHFILLTMVFHSMDIDIVTADKFGDHVESLDTLTRRDFQRWMRAHQIVLKKFTDNGQPIFCRRENFDIDVQSTESSWHIPGPNRQWLCCVRR